MSSNTDEFILGVPKGSIPFLDNFQGLGPFIYSACQKYGDKIAQIDSITDRAETFENMNKRAVQVALELTAMGIKSGDMITLCSVNSVDEAAIVMGGWYIGALLSFLQVNTSQQSIRYFLKEGKPKLLFWPADHIMLIEDSMKGLDFHSTIIIFDEKPNIETPFVPFSSFFQQWRNAEGFEPFKPNSVQDTAVVLFSSGTTGLAKGICLHHYGLLYNFVDGKIWPPQHSLETLMHFSTLYWISGVCRFLLTFLTGAKRVLVPNFDENTVLDVLTKFKVNYITSLVYNILKLKNTNYKSFNLTNLHLVTVGGTPTTKEQILLAREIFPHSCINQVYGLTENCGLVTTFDPQTHQHFIKTKPDSVGMILPGIFGKVVDIDTGKSLGPNCKGELRIKSPSMMNSFYNRDSSEAWDSEGWLKTGDILYYDEDGCFYVVDRIKEVMKFRHWHIFPGAIETVLVQHPLVEEAMVVGVPKEGVGDLATAIVTLEKDQEHHKNALEKELLKFVEDRMELMERLHGGLKIVESIPKTSSGKPSRAMVRRMAIEGKL